MEKATASAAEHRPSSRNKTRRRTYRLRTKQSPASPKSGNKFPFTRFGLYDASLKYSVRRVRKYLAVTLEEDQPESMDRMKAAKELAASLKMPEAELLTFLRHKGYFEKPAATRTRAKAAVLSPRAVAVMLIIEEMEKRGAKQFSTPATPDDDVAEIRRKFVADRERANSPKLENA
jgi:hypothetical protein